MKRRLYRRIAAHLAGAGFDVLTWDWRGTGDSRPASLRGFDATMTDWATRDLAGAIAWAQRERGGRPIVAVGHSFGGQAMGLAPGARELAALVTVAAQSGWYGHWPAPRRWVLAALWRVAVPSLVAALGWFPSRRFGIGEELPAGVALEWARWCRSPGYLGDHHGWAGHRTLGVPVLALSFDGDPIAPPRAVAALHREYAAGAPVTMRHVGAAESGRPLGHFGFFRDERARPLWDEVAAWLRATIASGTEPRP